MPHRWSLCGPGLWESGGGPEGDRFPSGAPALLRIFSWMPQAIMAYLRISKRDRDGGRRISLAAERHLRAGACDPVLVARGHV